MGRPTKRFRGKSSREGRHPDWDYDANRFARSTSPKDTADERAEKERLIAEHMAKRKR